MVRSLIGIFLPCIFFIACSGDNNENTGVRGNTEVAQVKVEQTLPGISDGERIFNTNCLACHASGAGHPGTMQLAIRRGKENSVISERTDLSAEYIKLIVRQGIMLMPPFRPSEISDSELHALAVFLSSDVKN